MLKKGPKIKELARDLGVTPKKLFLRCRDEGLDVQNSVSRLTPKQEAEIRGWFEENQPAVELPETTSE